MPTTRLFLLCAALALAASNASAQQIRGLIEKVDEPNGLITVQRTPGLPLQFLNPEFLNPLGQFYRSNFYHSLDSDLRAGRSMSTVSNGKIISVAEAHRMVARARAEGWRRYLLIS
jgi:hypothetical protein